MESMFLNVVEAVIDIDPGLRLTSFQLKRFECGPASQACRQIGAAGVLSETKYAPVSSENVHLQRIPLQAAGYSAAGGSMAPRVTASLWPFGSVT